jgi:hypothetical protein
MGPGSEETAAVATNAALLALQLWLWLLYIAAMLGLWLPCAHIGGCGQAAGLEQ